MKLHQVVTAALVLLLLMGTVRTPLRGEGQDGAAAPTELGLVRASPESFLGKELVALVQVREAPRAWNPYLTRFGPADYSALSVWSDQQLLWLPEEYENPFGLVFARRGTPADSVFASARPYERYRVRGRVRECFLGRAWIEVEAAERVEGELGEGAILHASRAVQLMAGSQWSLALADLDRALIGDLPAHARAALAELRAACAAELAKNAR